MNKLGVFALVFALIACGSPDTPAPGGIEGYARVDKQEKIGREQWLFSAPLKGLTSEEHFVLEGMFLAPEGSLTLHSHFNGFNWRDGVQLHFHRENDRLHLDVVVPGSAVRSLDLGPDFVTTTGRFKLRLEIHNGGLAGVRVLIWKYGLSQKGNLENPRTFISEANADFDSSKVGWIFTDHGRGAQWAIEFDRARVTQIYREAPYAL